MRIQTPFTGFIPAGSDPEACASCVFAGYHVKMPPCLWFDEDLNVRKCPVTQEHEELCALIQAVVVPSPYEEAEALL